MASTSLSLSAWHARTCVVAEPAEGSAAAGMDAPINCTASHHVSTAPVAVERRLVSYVRSIRWVLPPPAPCRWGNDWPATCDQYAGSSRRRPRAGGGTTGQLRAINTLGPPAAGPVPVGERLLSYVRSIRWVLPPPAPCRWGNDWSATCDQYAGSSRRRPRAGGGTTGQLRAINTLGPPAAGPVPVGERLVSYHHDHRSRRSSPRHCVQPPRWPTETSRGWLRVVFYAGPDARRGCVAAAAQRRRDGCCWARPLSRGGPLDGVTWPHTSRASISPQCRCGLSGATQSSSS